MHAILLATGLNIMAFVSQLYQLLIYDSLHVVTDLIYFDGFLPQVPLLCAVYYVYTVPTTAPTKRDAHDNTLHTLAVSPDFTHLQTFLWTSIHRRRAHSE